MSGHSWFLFAFAAFVAVAPFSAAMLFHYIFRENRKSAWFPPAWGFPSIIGGILLVVLFGIFLRADEYYAEMYQGRPAASLEPGVYLVDYVFYWSNSDGARAVDLVVERPRFDLQDVKFVRLDRTSLSGDSIQRDAVYEVYYLIQCRGDRHSRDCTTTIHFRELPEQ